MNNNLTANEIIEALGRCGYHQECCFCNSVEECGSKRVLVANVLSFVGRQKAEIERLKKDKYKLQKALNQSEDYRVIAKAEAYKECIEKVKELMDGWGDLEFHSEAIKAESDLNNLLKELERKENTAYDD